MYTYVRTHGMAMICMQGGVWRYRIVAVLLVMIDLKQRTEEAALCTAPMHPMHPKLAPFTCTGSAMTMLEVQIRTYQSMHTTCLTTLPTHLAKCTYPEGRIRQLSNRYS